MIDKMCYAGTGAEWMEGLPVGNGRLAAMIWGDDSTDILNLNHEWLWRGKHKDREVIPAKEYLDEVRTLLRERNFFKANLVANLYFGGEGGITPSDNRVDPYQPAGALEFKLDGVTEFERRELDIFRGVYTNSRKTANGSVVSEVYASCENDLIMASWSSEGKFSGTLKLTRVQDAEAVYEFKAYDSQLVFDCAFIGGIKHRVVTDIQIDGKRTVLGDALEIKDATYIRCITNIATSVFDLEAEINKYQADFDAFTSEKDRHTAKFSSVMNNVKLELSEDEALDSLNIEQRLARLQSGERDNKLVELYFNFGRYLMVASSVNGELPANMQGKWNDKIVPDWDCDYHFDINFEMNYWMAEPCNMPQCAEAFLKLIEGFYESGQKAAKELYGCRGIWLPIQTDAWGRATPESFGWAVWVGAAPWLAQNFWNHYTYTGDLGYLKDRGYKFLKMVAEFFEDYLVEDGDGVLQVMPSQSPENTFAEACGYFYLPVGICVSAAMDVQLIFDAFTYAIDAAEILEIDAERVQIWKKMRSKLPKFEIGGDGRLLEWNEEKEERPDELGHRHLSHLYGVFPSSLFTAETRSAQYEAARRSLDFRLAHGGGHTGWSRAWVACLESRFGNAEGFYENFIALIRDFATITLLDLHPPRIFQIDGNLGAVMALIEAVVSFTDGKVHLLRSLPKQLNTGRLEGIKVPGGHVIDVAWADGRVTELKVTIGFGEAITVSNINGEERRFCGKQGETFEWAEVIK